MLITIHPTTYRSGGFLAHGVLKDRGVSIEIIAETSGLSAEEIDKL